MLAVNEYFEGQVKSIGFQGEGKPASVGVMEAGVYEFGTAKPEVMQVLSGALTVLLPGSDEWQTFNAGDKFDVVGDAKFQVKVSIQTAYLCIYG
ncbi:pyrimidine/purine nucleoside phosphorylase [Shewanella sp. D64]|uniref:pyrimidine/purine nucleoside phosphorylase n=1 Tax=unclassified Shewanella TaxID=196818 RepID=UPI0022BA40A1|nr:MULTISPECIES: pyrimidine/purine nucleoside phosphorylase [unclassified Shewanella]MEC4725594.1 pyrimidine/purine nucleoside phosphorylase [Shewanella sp. D64]MEC4739646.1 pyrimidine/purine nucleoside phosphorylase [Shewanella sp. E94]WBJ94887.1 pyrimidine/purine nucleoside phosphorylase [Shewanella sp. MTB7]